MDNSKTYIKIKLKRLIQLQKQFKYNYDNLSRDIFNTIDDSTKLMLINNELFLDKKLNLMYANTSIIKKICKYEDAYFYIPAFSNLNNSYLQAHIRHNLYRTISALSLENCSLEEKAIILAKSTNLSLHKYPKLLDISIQRLNCLNEYLNNLTL